MSQIYRVRYQTTSEEKYKTNEKRIRSIGAISFEEKNPKNCLKLLKCPKWHFLVVLGTFLETGSSDWPNYIFIGFVFFFWCFLRQFQYWFWGSFQTFFGAQPKGLKTFFWRLESIFMVKVCSKTVKFALAESIGQLLILRPHPTVDLGQCKFENHWKPGLSRPGHPIVQFTVDLGP